MIRRYIFNKFSIGNTTTTTTTSETSLSKTFRNHDKQELVPGMLVRLDHAHQGGVMRHNSNDQPYRLFPFGIVTKGGKANEEVTIQYQGECQILVENEVKVGDFVHPSHNTGVALSNTYTAGGTFATALEYKPSGVGLVWCVFGRG